MTVAKLIEVLSGLPEDQQQLPVQLECWYDDENKESRAAVEVIDTVLPPLDYGHHLGRVTLTAWN